MSALPYLPHYHGATTARAEWLSRWRAGLYRRVDGLSRQLYLRRPTAGIWLDNRCQLMPHLRQ